MNSYPTGSTFLFLLRSTRTAASRRGAGIVTLVALVSATFFAASVPTAAANFAGSWTIGDDLLVPLIGACSFESFEIDSAAASSGAVTARHTLSCERRDTTASGEFGTRIVRHVITYKGVLTEAAGRRALSLRFDKVEPDPTGQGRVEETLLTLWLSRDGCRFFGSQRSPSGPPSTSSYSGTRAPGPWRVVGRKVGCVASSPN
jgi:hypothetical protein